MRIGMIEVSYEGLGVARQPIPDAVLFQGGLRTGNGISVLSPGARWRSYEGTWRQVPPFDRLRPCTEGVASNFDLSVRSRQNHVGLCFEGWLEVTQSDVYKFTVGSARGAQLFIGLPTMKVIRHTSVPVPRSVNLGQILSSQSAGFWAEAKGDVDFVHRGGAGELALALSSSTGRLHGQIPDGARISPARCPRRSHRLYRA